MRAVVLPGGVHRDDVRVVQLGGCGRLAPEAIHGAGRQAEARPEHLQGDPAAQRDLDGLVDDAHTAPAQLAGEFKVAETCRWLIHSERPLPSVAVLWRNRGLPRRTSVWSRACASLRVAD